MSTGNALSWTGSTVARFRDALRTLRGKRPKYTALAKQMECEQHTAHHHWVNPPRGICSEADIKCGILAPDECEFFELLLADARRCPGPIIQFGTLLGDTIDTICAAKSSHQKVVTIDPAGANPWSLPPETYRVLSNRLLHHWQADGKVTQLSLSPREYFRTYRDAPPALVFLNFVRSYDEARHIIRWAKTVGAETIAGRGYDFSYPDYLNAVDEAGGPDAVEGGVWRLRLATPKSRAASGASTALPSADSRPAACGLVSIVMPAFNAQEFIEFALDDVSRQTYGNWELIVVEDGSIDDVGGVIEKFQSRHPAHRIVYHRKPNNSGVSSTRNEAMSLCRGEFIAFLDADDRWSPDHLQRKVRLLCQTGCDLAYSRVDAFDSASNRSISIWGPNDDELQNFPESMFSRPYLQPSGVVVRQSLIVDVGNFDEELDYAEDYDYWFRAIQAGKLFCFDEKVTSRYRKNHASAATTDRLVACCQGVAQVTCRHLSLLGAEDAGRRRIVAKHFLMAGTGHLAFRPSRRNGCDPEVGRQLLQEAWRVGGNSWRWRKYYLLAKLAVATRTTAVFRSTFRRKYQRLWN